MITTSLTSGLSMQALPRRAAAPNTGSGSAPADGQPGGAPPPDKIVWSEALSLPAYTFGGGAAAMSSLSGFADRFPAGGFTLNPTGVIANPDWTRNLAPGTTLRNAQPILAAFSAGICLSRGMFEVCEGLKSGSNTRQLAGAIDLTLAATSLMQLASPGIAGVASIALVVARGIVEAHEWQ